MAQGLREHPLLPLGLLDLLALRDILQEAFEIDNASIFIPDGPRGCGYRYDTAIPAKVFHFKIFDLILLRSTCIN